MYHKKYQKYSDINMFFEHGPIFLNSTSAGTLKYITVMKFTYQGISRNTAVLSWHFFVSVPFQKMDSGLKYAWDPSFNNWILSLDCKY